MFDFLKKTKKQVAENVEKNENLSVKSDSIFPDAKDAFETAKQKWKSITPDEILKGIQDESRKGNREVRFWNSSISDELLKELRAQGYRVEISKSLAVGPYFYVYW